MATSGGQLTKTDRRQQNHISRAALRGKPFVLHDKQNTTELQILQTTNFTEYNYFCYKRQLHSCAASRHTKPCNKSMFFF
jgi:hypothetical protein